MYLLRRGGQRGGADCERGAHPPLQHHRRRSTGLLGVQAEHRHLRGNPASLLCHLPHRLLPRALQALQAEAVSRPPRRRPPCYGRRRRVCACFGRWRPLHAAIRGAVAVAVKSRICRRPPPHAAKRATAPVLEAAAAARRGTVGNGGNTPSLEAGCRTPRDRRRWRAYLGSARWQLD